jgi:hypothetical protein
MVDLAKKVEAFHLFYWNKITEEKQVVYKLEIVFLVRYHGIISSTLWLSILKT